MIAEQSAGRTSPSGRGRPPVLLRLDASVGAALGIDFGHRHVRVAVADLSSTVLAERVVALEVDDDAATALDAAADLAAEVLAEAGTDRSRLIGAGMALSGPLDRDTGTVASTVVPGWAGVNAGEELSQRLGVQVEVDNDANLGALAEVSFGAGRGLADVIYVMMSAGVGAGLVLGRPPAPRVDRHRRRARPRPGAGRRRRLPLRKPRLPRDRRLHRGDRRPPPPRSRQRPHAAGRDRARGRRRPRRHAGRQRRRPRSRAHAGRPLQPPEPGRHRRRRRPASGGRAAHRRDPRPRSTATRSRAPRRPSR